MRTGAIHRTLRIIRKKLCKSHVGEEPPRSHRGGRGLNPWKREDRHAALAQRELELPRVVQRKRIEM